MAELITVPRPLRLGAAYHGNRMPHHAAEDFRDMASHGMDLVVHMLSHTDLDRHLEVMRRLVGMSEDAGLEPWIDNWGLGGPPGDKSHFLSYSPESHVIMSDGKPDPVRVCVNSPAFRKFTRDWIDAVEHIGGKTIFWDEPHLPRKTVDGKTYYGCTCERCRALFESKYGHPMPESPDAETEEFGAEQIAGYFAEMTEYSHSKGIRNAVCVMIGFSIYCAISSSLPFPTKVVRLGASHFCVNFFTVTAPAVSARKSSSSRYSLAFASFCCGVISPTSTARSSTTVLTLCRF